MLYVNAGMGFNVVKNFSGIWIILCLPGILSATCSSSKANCNTHAVKPSSNKSLEKEDGRQCVHGISTENDSCECNPCWSGPKCQDYVDRFAPRFLAEEPFFILDPIHPAGSSNPGHYSKLSTSNFLSSYNNETKTPLFRIEASDDDLGLTCILHQVGPSATCPCATPRYSVVGTSKKMFYADQETGDVFLQDGYRLDPGKYYHVTVQVGALEVIGPGYKPWKEKLTATLYIRSKGMETNDLVLLRNQQPPVSKSEGDENESEYSSSSSSSSSEESSPELLGLLSSSFYFPQIKFGEMKSNSIFRYRRQVKTPVQKKDLKKPEKIKLYFYTETSSSSSQLQSLSPEPVTLGEKIKVLVQVQIPTPTSKNKSSWYGSLPQNFSIEVSAHNMEMNDVRIAICSANISRIGRFLSLDPIVPILIPDNNYPIAKKVRVDIRNLQRICKDDLKYSRNLESQIDLEVVLFSYNYFSELNQGSKSSSNNAFSKPPNNEAETLHQSGKLRIESQILFPFTQKEQLYGRKSVEKVEAFIEIPFKQRKKTRDLNLLLNGETKENRQGMHHSIVETYGVEITGPHFIPEGKPMPYTVKVYVDDDVTTELRLSLQQVWIENVTQDVIEIRSLELVKAGKKIQFCTSFSILKKGFRGECTGNTTSTSSNLGRNGCFLYSPLLITKCEGRETKLGPGNNDDRLKENVLEFRAIIYGISKRSPDSQFHLEAIAEYKRHDGSSFSSPSPEPVVVMTESLLRSSPTLVDKFTNLQGSGVSRTTKIEVITGKVVSSNNMIWKTMMSSYPYQTKPEEEPQVEKLLTPQLFHSNSNMSSATTPSASSTRQQESSQNVLKITLQKNKQFLGNSYLTSTSSASRHHHLKKRGNSSSILISSST